MATILHHFINNLFYFLKDSQLLNFANGNANASFTAQKMKFSIKGFFSKCDQIRSFLQIWSLLLNKSLMENFIFCRVFLK